MAFDAFTGYLQLSFNYNAGKNGPSSGLNLPGSSVGNTVNLKKSYTVGGNLAGAINETVVEILTIVASGSATIDLTSLTDVLGISVSLARLKEYLFCLLSTAQDSVNGTACTSASIGNAGTNGNALNMGAVANTQILTNGDPCGYATTSAGGITVDSTHKNVLCTNNDGSHGAGLLVCLGGATT